MDSGVSRKYFFDVQCHDQCHGVIFHIEFCIGAIPQILQMSTRVSQKNVQIWIQSCHIETAKGLGSKIGNRYDGHI